MGTREYEEQDLVHANIRCWIAVQYPQLTTRQIDLICHIYDQGNEWMLTPVLRQEIMGIGLWLRQLAQQDILEVYYDDRERRVTCMRLSEHILKDMHDLNCNKLEDTEETDEDIPGVQCYTNQDGGM